MKKIIVHFKKEELKTQFLSSQNFLKYTLLT